MSRYRIIPVFLSAMFAVGFPLTVPVADAQGFAEQGAYDPWASHPDKDKNEMPLWASQGKMSSWFSDARIVMGLLFESGDPVVRFWNNISEEERAACPECTGRVSRYLIEENEIWMRNGAIEVEVADLVLQSLQVRQKNVGAESLGLRIFKSERAFMIKLLQKKRPSLIWPSGGF